MGNTPGVSVYLDSGSARRVLSKLDDIEKAAQPQLVKACLAGAQVVNNDAKRRVPVRTGTLKRSIHVEPEEDGALVGTDVEYAKYVELGTSERRAKPYLRPALNENKQRVEQAVNQAMKELLK